MDRNEKQNSIHNRRNRTGNQPPREPEKPGRGKRMILLIPSGCAMLAGIILLIVALHGRDRAVETKPEAVSQTVSVTGGAEGGTAEEKTGESGIVSMGQEENKPEQKEPQMPTPLPQQVQPGADGQAESASNTDSQVPAVSEPPAVPAGTPSESTPAPDPSGQDDSAAADSGSVISSESSDSRTDSVQASVPDSEETGSEADGAVSAADSVPFGAGERNDFERAMDESLRKAGLNGGTSAYYFEKYEKGEAEGNYVLIGAGGSESKTYPAGGLEKLMVLCAYYWEISVKKVSSQAARNDASFYAGRVRTFGELYGYNPPLDENAAENRILLRIAGSWDKNTNGLDQEEAPEAATDTVRKNCAEINSSAFYEKNKSQVSGEWLRGLLEKIYNSDLMGNLGNVILSEKWDDTHTPGAFTEVLFRNLEEKWYICWMETDSGLAVRLDRKDGSDYDASGPSGSKKSDSLRYIFVLCSEKPFEQQKQEIAELIVSSVAGTLTEEKKPEEQSQGEQKQETQKQGEKPQSTSEKQSAQERQSKKPDKGDAVITENAGSKTTIIAEIAGEKTDEQPTVNGNTDETHIEVGTGTNTGNTNETNIENTGETNIVNAGGANTENVDATLKSAAETKKY